MPHFWTEPEWLLYPQWSNRRVSVETWVGDLDWRLAPCRTVTLLYEEGNLDNFCFKCLLFHLKSLLFKTILFYPTKITAAFFTGIEQTILKFVWNHKRPWVAKSIQKKKTNSGLQAILQSCNHQDGMVLAQEQTLRSVEQNREPRNGPTDIWPTHLWQNRKEYPVE